jgi:predicted cupin superfamily sugar epimerase
MIPKSALPERYSDQRLAGTCIYYLLEPETFSEMHRLHSDEIYHFYLGDPIELLMLHPDGSGETVLVGSDIEGGQLPQLVIPRNVWQGSRLVPGGKFALIGCTVSPGFDFVDYESGSRNALISTYPQFEEQIIHRTH